MVEMRKDTDTNICASFLVLTCTSTWVSAMLCYLFLLPVSCPFYPVILLTPLPSPPYSTLPTGDYDYYLRLDSDCYVTKLNYDIFQWAEDNNVSYTTPLLSSLLYPTLPYPILSYPILPLFSIPPLPPYIYDCYSNSLSSPLLSFLSGPLND